MLPRTDDRLHAAELHRVRSSLHDVLKLAPTGRTPAQLRAAFSRADTAAAGYINVVVRRQNLFDDSRYGDLPDTASTAEINDLSQSSGGRRLLSDFSMPIGWENFICRVLRRLGGADRVAGPAGPRQVLDPADSSKRRLDSYVLGELKVGDRFRRSLRLRRRLLKQEAARLKNELATYAQSSGRELVGAEQQVHRVDRPEQRVLLVSKMTPLAREAAAELVNYVLLTRRRRARARSSSFCQQVTGGAAIRDQICRWQIVVDDVGCGSSRRRARRGGGSVDRWAAIFFFVEGRRACRYPTREV